MYMCLSPSTHTKLITISVNIFWLSFIQYELKIKYKTSTASISIRIIIIIWQLFRFHII